MQEVSVEMELLEMHLGSDVPSRVKTQAKRSEVSLDMGKSFQIPLQGSR